MSAVSGVCAKGHYCPEGSDSEYSEPCPAGTYNNVFGGKNATFCLTCPTSSYCPQASIVPIDCPDGSYCPEGSVDYTFCPAGTFGNVTRLGSLTDCHTCPPGQFCDGRGLTAPTGPCSPGYFCKTGSTSSEPFVDAEGGLCPSGHYCDQGAAEPLACPQVCQIYVILINRYFHCISK